MESLWFVGLAGFAESVVLYIRLTLGLEAELQKMCSFYAMSDMF